MNKPGYVIARNRKGDGYFTTTSAYDRPNWIDVNEATVFYSPEMAQQAAVKLAKHGAYQCKVIPLREAIELSLPDDVARDEVDDGVEVEFSASDDGNSEMVAQDQEDPCDQCQHCPCTCDQDTDGVDDYVDAELADNMSRSSPAGAELADRLRVGESTTMPAKPSLDAKSTENSTTAPDLKASEVIKYKQPAEEHDNDTKLTNYTAHPHDEKIKVPANVMSDLKKVIDEYAKEGKLKDAKDDTRASFCMTVASAFEQLQQYLEQGTVEGLKLAQVHLTSLMNPITTNLPNSVHKYIMMGGRKPSLKDLFDENKQNQRLKEATNHLGERTLSTFAGWKRAVKQQHPNAWFDGDADICNAFIGPKPYVRGETKGVGEWDGAEGSLYK